MDSGKDQPSPIEFKFATPRIVKNARTGQTYSTGIGIPRETYQKELATVFPPNKPHFFTVDSFKLVVERKLNDPLVEASNLSILFMHGEVRNGRWIPQDLSLQQKGITVEDIVYDYEVGGKENVDVVLVCSDINTALVKVVPFSEMYQKPKIFMKDKPAHVNVSVNPKTGAITAQMRVESADDVEYQRWKNYGRVKIQP